MKLLNISTLLGELTSEIEADKRDRLIRHMTDSCTKICKPYLQQSSASEKLWNVFPESSASSTGRQEKAAAHPLQQFIGTDQKVHSPLTVTLNDAVSLSQASSQQQYNNRLAESLYSPPMTQLSADAEHCLSLCRTRYTEAYLLLRQVLLPAIVRQVTEYNKDHMIGERIEDEEEDDEDDGEHIDSIDEDLDERVDD